MAETTNQLVPLEKLLEAGVHIGSKFKTGNMKRFVYKHRNDGLCVLDVNQTQERIRIAARFLATYDPEDILIVAGRAYAQKPAKTMAETIQAKYVIGRFIPGTLTNPANENFVEPRVVLVADPPIDRQAIQEAKKAKIPVISLCDSSNLTKNIDLVIPANNKGKKSLALIFWLLTREFLKNKGIIKSDSEFKKRPEEYESGRERRQS